MTDFLKAAESAKALVRGFGGLSVLAEAFEQAGRLQQTLDETGAALVAARAQLDETKVQAAQIHLDATNAKAAAQAIHAQAVHDSHLAVEAAQVAAAKQTQELAQLQQETTQDIADRLAEANTTLQSIVAAQLTAEKAVNDTNERMAAMRAQVAALASTVG
jgi:predicted  nucleic acid-binding Zn-ribbon protein